MKIFKQLKNLVAAKKDAAEWDANDPAGIPLAYDKDYASEVEYDHTQFAEKVE